MKAKKVNRVSLGYKGLPMASLAPFGGWVITCMIGNPSFPEPPVPLVPPNPPNPALPLDMTTRIANLQDAMKAAEGGGIIPTSAKNAAYDVVIEGMDKLAFYVQTVARFDLTMLLTSGFQATNTNRSQSPLDTPAIVGIDNNTSTQLDVHVSPIANAYVYEVQTSITGTDWKTAKFSTQARTIILTGLTTGTVYQVRVRALGGSTGQSDWSTPSSSIVD
jgi:hypothetical protein